MKKTNIHRNYKDSLFRMIFQNKKELLSLYNAVNHSEYNNPDDLTIHMLEDVLYMGIKNDISFLIGDYLNLYEAQSTWNPNMPLRYIFYLAELYKGYVEENHLDIYSSTPLKLPTPRCIVFYNGVKKIEDVKQIRLSESFECLNQKAAELECVVTYININYGHNEEIMRQCRKLYEYSFLIDQIRIQIANGKQLETAVKHAVNYCVENGVLADFLEKHRAEVTNVILSEYNAQQHIENEKEISYRDGKAAGAREGRCEGIKEGSIRSYIEIYSEQGLPDDEIRKKLKGRFQIDDMQLEEYMKKYSGIL